MSVRAKCFTSLVAMAVVGLFLLSSFFPRKKKSKWVTLKKKVYAGYTKKKSTFFPLTIFHARVTFSTPAAVLQTNGICMSAHFQFPSSK